MPVPVDTGCGDNSHYRRNYPVCPGLPLMRRVLIPGIFQDIDSILLSLSLPLHNSLPAPQQPESVFKSSALHPLIIRI